MKKGRWLAVAGLLAAMLAGPAAAQQTGLYLGGSAGVALFKETCEGSPILGTCDDNDVAWRGFLGYQFNRNVALEAGYVDLGSLKAEGSFLGAPTTFTAEPYGFDLSLVLNFGLMDRLSLLARIGAYRLRTVLDANIGGVPSSDADTNSGFTYGLGLAFDVGRLGLRAEWQRYDNVGGGAIGEDTADLFMLGLRFTFF